MSEFMGPPSWWYNPPEGHEPECNCQCDCRAGVDEDGDPVCTSRGLCGCHGRHVENGEVEDNAKSPDFQCCVDQLEERREQEQKLLNVELPRAVGE